MSKIRYMGVLLLAMVACRQPQAQKEADNMENNQVQASQEQPQSVYDFEFKTLMGQDIALADFKGRKMLLVNVASECGFTPQYKELQELYDKYGDKVVVLGFPANDFGGQEPGSHEEIAQFCERNYGVKFPVFEKIAVTGPDTHPLYQYLSDKARNGVTDAKPTWNFCKYLIDEKGKVMGFFPSKVSPMSEEIISAIHQ
ncbi:MAG: glutathione peroxidase [Adhaeribacter sp.]